MYLGRISTSGVFAGTIASGTIRKGAEIISMPSGQKTKVKSIVAYEQELEEAFAPQSVVITTTDEIDISRGCILARPNNVPVLSNNFDADIVWMYENEVKAGQRYTLKTSTQSVPVTISNIRYKFDVNTLHRKEAAELSMNDIARIQITSHRQLCYDSYSKNKQTGSFILIDNLSNATVAAGMILQTTASTDNESISEIKSTNIFKEHSNVAQELREKNSWS